MGLLFRCTTPALAARLLALLAVAGLAACSTLQHGYKASDVAGRSLATASPPGAERLELEAQYDSAVREMIESRGRPEFLHVVDRDNLYLFYTEKDQVVVIRRLMVPPGEIQLFERTPGYLLKLLPKAPMDRLLQQREVRDRARRAERKRTARRTAATQPSSRPRRQPPAARASGVSFRDFDPDRIVERLRTSLSAADPGVTGWRKGRLSDGSSARFAKAGTTQYRVSNESVTVSAAIPPRGREIPKRANRGVHRVNHAVFGTRAAKITRQVASLVSRVAADTSGRTRIVRRVAGRTVTVSRDPDRAVLVYSVRR